MHGNQENFKENNEPRFSSPEEEIKYLREEIERRQEITKNFGERIKKEDHIKDIIREHASQEARTILPNEFIIKDYEKKVLLEGLIPKDTDEKVSEIVSIMLDKGVHTSINLVKDSKDKNLEDDFHRFLINFLLTKHGEKLEKGLSKTE